MTPRPKIIFINRDDPHEVIWHKIVVSGHTHRAYNCRIDGRLVTSADKYGTLVSEIDLTLDPHTGDVIASRADNLIVRKDRFAKDPAQTALIATYEQLAAPLQPRTAPIPRADVATAARPMGALRRRSPRAAGSLRRACGTP